ncbi:metallophosphoesterase [Eubacteriales bacterium OttesenSCG-928-M02]|nr:metallophosphoesterase [Eubacteriales bacterium OttesenSCG-928-M02]
MCETIIAHEGFGFKFSFLSFFVIMGAMKQLFKRKKRWFVLALLCLVCITYLYWQNNGLMVTNYTIVDDALPPEMDGLTIVQISDLHNKSFGSNQKRLLSAIQEAQPDIILLTGDLIDRRRKGMDHALSLVSQAIEIAPVYYITGNHEEGSSEYPRLKAELQSLGVIMLDNRSVPYVKNGAEITLAGIHDPARMDTTSFSRSEEQSAHKAYAAQCLEAAMANVPSNAYTILLAHRPSYFHLYQEKGASLVFSGHAHGGQIRIPFLGALLSPDEGFFPKYTAGVYQEGDSTLVVSRGLGNSIIPIRIHNRPELVVVTLRGSK